MILIINCCLLFRLTSQDFKRLKRQSAAWDIIDYDICRLVFGRTLTFDFEPHYYEFLEQNYEWVDKCLQDKSDTEEFRYFEKARDVEDEHDMSIWVDQNAYYLIDDVAEHDDDDQEEISEISFEDEDVDEYYRQQDFIADAEYYYEEMMDRKAEMKKKLSPSQYKKWEAKTNFVTNAQEAKYETYLKTGAIFM